MRNDKILDTIKDEIAGGAIHEHFDDELIEHINAVIFDLRQLGVGPQEGFVLTTGDETWGDYLGDDLTLLSSVPSLMKLKVERLFDPSASSAISSVKKEEIGELEWRLNIAAEYGL